MNKKPTVVGNSLGEAPALAAADRHEQATIRPSAPAPRTQPKTPTVGIAAVCGSVQSGDAISSAPKPTTTVGGKPGFQRQPPPATNGVSDTSSDSVSVVNDPPSGRLSASVAVRDLKPTTADPWTLVGQIVSRGAIRNWKNLRGSGRLLDLLVVDSVGDTIKATIFGQGIDMFGDLLRSGATCSFSGGKVKVPNRAFSSAAYELIFDHHSSIRAVPLDEAPTLDDVPLGKSVHDLHTAGVAEEVNLFGILTRVDGSKRITTAKGHDCWKRDILVVDSSMCKVICTVWGMRAREDLSQYEGQPVLIERGTVNDFSGMRSINVGLGAAIHFAPAHPDATRLRSWYANSPDEAEFSFVQAPGGSS